MDIQNEPGSDSNLEKPEDIDIDKNGTKFERTRLIKNNGMDEPEIYTNDEIHEEDEDLAHDDVDDGEDVIKRVEVRPNSASFDLLFLKRFLSIVLTKIGIFSLKQFLLAFFVICFSVIGAIIQYWLNQAFTEATLLLVNENSSEAWVYVVYMILYAAVLFLCDFMTLNGFLNTSLSVLWRNNLTKNLLRKYYKNKNYYVILNLRETSVDNPDQVTVGGIRFFSMICVNFYIILKYRGYWLLIPVFLIPIISSSVYLCLFYPTSKTVFRKDSQEGDFRFAHARIREHAESMAFFQSGLTEKKGVSFLFRRLVNTLCCLGFWMFLVTLWTQIGYFTPNIVFISLLVLFLFTNTTPFRKNIPSDEVIGILTNLILSTQSFAQNVSNLLGLAQNLAVVIGNTARIGEMFEVMNRIEKQEKEIEQSGKIRNDPTSIQFENVTIRTPQGKLLVDHLDMKIEEGEHVIIMGPSGSGKSSILRVLCGLWPFDDGGILARPSKIGMGGILFLPQKPYLVSGSLTENIIYPMTEEDCDHVSDERLIRVMELAKIDYLLTRASLHDRKVFWEEKLSLGEQQRLQMARLFFHRPRFAVLDECTSALDPDNEDILYSTISRIGITILSVAHRKSVMKYHKWILEINNEKNESSGNTNNNYLLRRIKQMDLPDYEGIEWKPVASHAVLPEERDGREVERDVNANDMGNTGLNITLVRRIFRLCCCCVMIRQWWQCCFIFFAFVMASLMGLSPLFITEIVGKLFGCIVDRDLGHCVTYTTLISFGFLFVAIASGVSMMFFIYQGICCRANITSYIHDRYFKNNMFYEINVLDKNIDNPDQRICSDSDLLTSGFQVRPGISYMEYILLQSAVMVIASFVQSFQNSWIDPLYVLLVMLLSGLVQIFFMVALSKFRFIQQKREGYLRNSLTRMKEYSEQIAFFDGKRREEIVVQSRLRLALWNQFFLGIVNGGSGAFAMFVVNANQACVVAVVILSVRIKMINLSGLSNGDIVTMLMTHTQIMNTLVGVFLGTLKSMVFLGQIIGTVGRVSQLIEKMDMVDSKRETEKEEEENEERRIATTNWIGVENVTAETPTQKKLFYNLNFSQDRNMSVLIQGPSGCGKSSLLRIIGGIWKQPGPGKVFAPSHVGRDGLFFLPQKSYLILGTLKENVIYPHTRTRSTDEELLEILKDVNLGYIYDRVGGWESSREWSVILSPGEQQRIGMARLLYHRPAFAILDESTSALDEDNETLMYETCKKNSIAALSVGHRKSIICQHSHLLEFDASGGWVFSERVEDLVLPDEFDNKKEEEESGEEEEEIFPNVQ